MLRQILEALVEVAVVLVEGPPRSGKTLLASQLQRSTAASLVVDASAPEARAFLLEPELSLREAGRSSGQGAVLIVDRGEASPDLVDSLVGRFASGSMGRDRLVVLGSILPARSGVTRLELRPFSLQEVGRESRSRHWFRGGFPEAYAAENDEAALAWLGRYVESLAEARFSAAGLAWAPGRTRNLLSMIAEAHGSSLNENAVAASIGVSRPTIVRSVAALERLGLLRLLPSAAPPSGKRSVRSPALYLRDSGILHALLGFRSPRQLMGSSRLAASWEGYVIEEALRALPEGVEARRYRSKDGGALELLLSRGPRLLAAASIRWARQGRQAPRGAVSAAKAMASTPNYLVLPESEEGLLEDGFRTIGLRRFLDLVSDL